MSRTSNFAGADDPLSSDDQLLERFTHQRDESAFALLVRRHGAMVLRVCQRVLHQRQDAEDAFQAAFLLLARQARTIRDRKAVVGWLHGVAYRTALAARRAAQRRRQHEARARPATAPPPEHALAWREVEAVLEEEVARLPDKYRVVFVLCCQEGVCRADAARQLGIKEGTLSSRLDHARTVLQQRLTRRGVSLSAVLGAAALLASEVRATVPVELTTRTAERALRFAAGEKALALGCSPEVAALLGSVARSTLMRKLKKVGLCIVAGLLCVSVGAVAQQTIARSNGPEPTAAPVPPVAAGQPPESLPEHAAARLGTVRLRQGGSIHKLCFGPGGKTVLACSDGQDFFFGRPDRSLVLWDVSTGQAVQRFGRRNPSGATLLRNGGLSPDGKIVVAAYNTGELVLWDAATAKEVRTVKVDLDANVVVFAPDSKTLFVADWRKAPIVLLDVESGKERRRLTGPSRGVYRQMAVSADGKRLATPGSDDKGGVVYLWDVAAGTKQRELRGQRGSVEHLTFSHNGKLLASTDTNNTCFVWDVTTGERQRVLQHEDKSWIYGAAFTPNDETLITSGSDRTIRFWELATGKQTRTLTGLRTSGRALALTPDGKTLLAGAGSALHVWDVPTGRVRHAAEGHHARILDATFSTKGAMFATAGDDRVAILWDARTGRELRRFAGHGYSISAVDLSPDGKLLATGGNNDDASVRLWDTQTGKQLAKLDGHKYLGLLQFSSDGTRLVSADAIDGSVRVWSLPEGKLERSWNASPRRASGVAVSPDGRTLISADDPEVRFSGIDVSPKPLRIWDVTTGKEKGTLDGHTGSQLRCLAFAPDGKVFASAGNGFGDQFLRLWDLSTRKEIRRIKVLAEKMTFSRDGKTLATTDWRDNTILLWEVSTGEERGRFEGHPGRTFALSFSADGALLASAGEDTTGLLWDVRSLGLAGQRAAPTPRELEGLWDQLAGDGEKAFRAGWRLAAHPAQSVPFLRTRLRTLESRQIDQLIRDLDSDIFGVREQAERALETAYEQAEPALREARAGKPSLEKGRRIDRLTQKLSARAGRITEALEHAGTAEARQLLQALHDRSPTSRLGEEAQASLGRLR